MDPRTGKKAPKKAKEKKEAKKNTAETRHEEPKKTSQK